MITLFSFIFSCLFAAAGFLCCLINRTALSDTPTGCIIWAAEAFAVSLIMGYVGLKVSLLCMKKKYAAAKCRNIAVSLVLCLVLGAATGAVGQALFALEKQEKKIEIEPDPADKPEEKKHETKSISFIMDESASLLYIYENCVEATCNLIDKLNENHYFQYITFTRNVDKKTDLLQLTQSNKDSIKATVNTTHADGGYNYFYPPLQYSYDTLTTKADADSEKIVIMFTDCLGDYESEMEKLIDDYAESDITVYIIKTSVSESDKIDPDCQLAEIADEVFHLIPDENGDYSMDNIYNILAITTEVDEEPVEEPVKKKTRTETKIALGTESILFSQKNTVWKVLIRILTFSVFSLLTSFVYYGAEDKKKLLINLLPGAVSGVIFVIHPIAGLAASLIFILTAFTKFKTEQTNI
ncbi:MAG: VWA domain-containing protein [Clostridia bacterium]|nr:VWA domain-containing protein [Clostridia bacterium]